MKLIVFKTLMIFLLASCSEGDSGGKSDDSRIKTVVPTILDEDGNVLREGGVLDRDGNIVPAVRITSTPPMLNIGSGGEAGGDLSLSGFDLMRFTDETSGTWTLQENDKIVQQTDDKHASIYYDANFNQDSYKLSFIIETPDTGDDDGAGIIFGAQDSNNFYLLSMRREKADFRCEVARGVFVKKITGTSPPTEKDLWCFSEGEGYTAGDDLASDESAVLERSKKHRIDLDFDGEKYSLEVKDGANNQTLFSYEINDNSLKGGIGFFNYSTPNVKYSYQNRTSATSGYEYQVKTNSSDEGSLQYSLLESPDGMKIDANSGKITWPASDVKSGTHKVKVVVEDSLGFTSVQEFVLNV